VTSNSYRCLKTPTPGASSRLSIVAATEPHIDRDVLVDGGLLGFCRVLAFGEYILLNTFLWHVHCMTHMLAYVGTMSAVFHASGGPPSMRECYGGNMLLTSQDGVVLYARASHTAPGSFRKSRTKYLIERAW